jgi:hypothetical protein
MPLLTAGHATVKRSDTLCVGQRRRPRLKKI